MINQKKLHYPELNTIILERMFMERHVEAGSLPPGQHVFTIDSVVELQKLYSMHMGRKLIKSKAKPRNKQDEISDMHRRLLSPAVENYKNLNKTP
jgi:hypothetical protein